MQMHLRTLGDMIAKMTAAKLAAEAEAATLDKEAATLDEQLARFTAEAPKAEKAARAKAQAEVFAARDDWGRRVTQLSNLLDELSDRRNRARNALA